MRIFPWLCAMGLLGCGTDNVPQPPEVPPASTTVFLTPTQHLVRASMALRGVRPSVADLQAVDADPGQLPAIVDRYLATPEFASMIMDLHNEVLLLRIEQPNGTVEPLGPLAGKTFMQINNSVYDEPLRLIADVVMHDQPYTDIVTANYTMADQIVADVWGLPHTTAPDNWERTQWPDGRPDAGFLSSSAVFLRWRSPGFNYNRGRANMISRSLLCHDFLSSDIQVDTSINLADPDIVANAVASNPSCAGCHQTLDPLASYMFTQKGNIVAGNITALPLAYYLPGNTNQWTRTNKRPPMFFGQTAPGMDGLGQAIAADPRFAQCAAQHFASYLTEIPQAELSGAWVAKLQQQFVDSGYSAKQLAKAVVLSDQFRIAADTDATNAEGVIGYQKARPEQLDRMITDLTGFSWSTNSTTNARDTIVGVAGLLTSDYLGFRVLAGGIDGYFVTSPVFTMNATTSLTTRASAAAAADFAVERDATASTRTLFAGPPTASDEASVRAELTNLHARIYGELVATDDPSIDETYALFHDAFGTSGDVKQAWKIVLVGMLSDLRAIYY